VDGTASRQSRPSRRAPLPDIFDHGVGDLEGARCLAVYAYTADFTAGLKYFVPEWVAERIAQLL